jgi:hypothetical protein
MCRWCRVAVGSEILGRLGLFVTHARVCCRRSLFKGYIYYEESHSITNSYSLYYPLSEASLLHFRRSPKVSGRGGGGGSGGHGSSSGGVRGVGAGVGRGRSGDTDHPSIFSPSSTRSPITSAEGVENHLHSLRERLCRM